MSCLNSTLLFIGILLLTGCKPINDDPYTSISGLWKCEEIDEAANVKIFNVDIDKVRNYDDTFIISNFHNVGEESFIRASVIDSTLQIPTQSILNILLSGEGTISTDYKTIRAEYVIDDGGRTANYIATFFR